MSIARCRNCGKEFATYGNRKVYCSDECYHKDKANLSAQEKERYDKDDCFAYVSNGRNAHCDALKMLDCRHGKKCRFYKTQEEYLTGLRKYGGSRLNQ